jgi:transcription initiation factor TFIID subunit 5
MDLKVKNEISRTNSFTYSNISSLNGSQSPVDQQLTKLVKFIKSQTNVVVRRELESLLPPIVCHLFFEMLKGKEWQPAHDFLRKYSTLVGTPQEVTTQKVNGTFPTIVGPQQIHFLQPNTASHLHQHYNQKPPGSSANHQQPLNIDETKLVWFRELISNLSCVRRIEDGKDNKLIVNFRSCRYSAKVAKKTLSILNKYLSKHGHVLIIQILHVWFSMDVYDLHEESIDESSTSSDGAATNDCEQIPQVSRYNHKADRSSDPSYCDNPNDIQIQNSVKSNFLRNEFDNPVDQQDRDTDEAMLGDNMKLKRLGERLHRVESKYHKPIRIFNINYSEKR